MDTTAIKMRLSKAQIAIIWPGLAFIVLAFLTGQRTGTSEFEYPFRLYPLPHGFDSGTYRSEMMDRIVALWSRLKPKAKLGGRIEMNTIEIRTAILSARVNLQILRQKARDRRKWDAETKRRFKFDKNAIGMRKREVERVIKSLERSMKRANRRFLSVASQDQYGTLSKQWRAHLRWIRFNLAYFKPLPPVVRGGRIRQQRAIDLLVTMAEEGIRYGGYEPAEPGKLRGVVRNFARYSRRGRIRTFDLRYMLDNYQRRTAQLRLLDFIQKRLTLKEASNS